MLLAGLALAVGCASSTVYQSSQALSDVAAPATTTPVVAGAPVTFAVIGDYGVNNSRERAVAKLVASWTPAFVITTGDNYCSEAGGAGTGKYDDSGLTGPDAPAQARITKYESTRKQRWGRPEALTAARRYNALARAHGLSPTQLALAFCYTKWQVASTIIGVTSVAQLDENIDVWGTTLSPELLKQIDALRWELRDPAQ